MKWDYKITAYCGDNHPSPEAKPGEVLIETVHKGESSTQIEIAAFLARMSRGEISHITVGRMK